MLGCDGDELARSGVHLADIALGSHGTLEDGFDCARAAATVVSGAPDTGEIAQRGGAAANGGTNLRVGDSLAVADDHDDIPSGMSIV